MHHCLHVGHELMVRLVTLLGRADLDELDLVELVLPEEAARVAPARARLGAEARRVGHVGERQLRLVEDLV